MAYLARLYDFTPSTLIQSAQVDAEFAQLVDVLKGSKTDAQIKIIHAAATTLLELDNTGGGAPQEWKIANVLKLSVNSTGQLASVVSTGAAPFLVSSTTVVANLNADLLDGLEAAVFALTNADEVFDSGTDTILTVQGSSTASMKIDDTGHAQGEWRIHSDGGLLKVQVNDGGWTTVAQFDGVNDTPEDGAGAPLATEAYVETKKTAWSYGVFYAGGVDTSVIQAIWVVPDDVDTMQVDHLKWVFQSGSPTGTTQIKLQHKNAAGVEQNTVTISILIGDSSLVTLTSDISDWSLAVDDFLQWTIIADGGHQDISIHAQGWQSLI